ncbi:MAG: energy transducer TonB [Bacteroidota bacterium]
MKNYLLLLFVLIAPFGLKAQTKVTLSKDTTTYDASNIERQPTFPGGKDAFNKFVTQTIKYPAASTIQGDVELSFMVNTDGTLSDIKIAKSLAEDLDKEAIRILQRSPKWIPAKKNGKLIDCAATATVGFRLK